MALAERHQSLISKILPWKGRSPVEPTIVTEVDLPTCQVSEGDNLAGGIDTEGPSQPQPLEVKIIGSHNPFTGEIASYHKDIHGTSYLITLQEGSPTILE